MSEEKKESGEMENDEVRQETTEDEVVLEKSVPAQEYPRIEEKAPKDPTLTSYTRNDWEEVAIDSGTDEIPPGVKGWNWGAFCYHIFWGIGNKTYLPLLCLIPIFNIVWIFVCGAKGNEWAWKKGDYSSVEDFKMVQSTWNRAGVVNVIVSLIGSVILFVVYFIVLAIGLAAFSGNISHFDGNTSPNDYWYDDDAFEYEEGEISDIPAWSEEVFDKIKVATEVMDDQTNQLTYVDGTKYAELVNLVGEANDTYLDLDGGLAEAEWSSEGTGAGNSYAIITIIYDTKTGLIVDKSFNGE